MARVARIVSGGQTGVDRGGLDAAIELGLGYGGWCPADGWADDHPDPPGLLSTYPHLRPTEDADPARRTRLNVRDSDATLVVRRAGVDSPGTDLTEVIARELGRPHLVTAGDADAVRGWLDELPGELSLNVAGPRASEQPDAYEATRRLLLEVLGPVSRPTEARRGS